MTIKIDAKFVEKNGAMKDGLQILLYIAQKSWAWKKDGGAVCIIMK